jgi:hypothetical protein
MAPTTAGAKSAVNTFTFKGTYGGTLKFTPSSSNCLFGKTANGKSYMVQLAHLKGTLTGVGATSWGFGAFVPKQGTSHESHANVQAINETSFQSSATPITVFDETSGAVTYHGKSGSVTLKVEYRTLGSTTSSGTDTVIGSWSCPNGLDLG